MNKNIMTVFVFISSFVLLLGSHVAIAQDCSWSGLSIYLGIKKCSRVTDRNKKYNQCYDIIDTNAYRIIGEKVFQYKYGDTGFIYHIGRSVDVETDPEHTAYRHKRDAAYAQQNSGRVTSNIISASRFGDTLQLNREDVETNSHGWTYNGQEQIQIKITNCSSCSLIEYRYISIERTGRYSIEWSADASECRIVQER